MPASPSFPRLILASGSAYRKELLSRLRLPFDVIVPAIDETPLTGEAPEATALRLAREKARAVAKTTPDALIIGSDQVATLDGEQIGKPGNRIRWHKPPASAPLCKRKPAFPQFFFKIRGQIQRFWLAARFGSRHQPILHKCQVYVLRSPHRTQCGNLHHRISFVVSIRKAAFGFFLQLESVGQRLLPKGVYICHNRLL